MANVFERYSAKLVGVWTLLTYELYDSEEPDAKLISKPHGDKPLGRVVMSKSGYLSGFLLAPEVTDRLPSDNLQEVSDEALARIGRKLSTYGGFVQLHEREDGGLLWHTTVEIAGNPNLIGGKQTRRADLFEEDGKQYMILRPVKDYFLPDGRKGRGVLKWQKIAD